MKEAMPPQFSPPFSPLDALVERFPVPGWRPIAIGILCLMTTGAVWAQRAELDEVVIATGTVIPQGEVKVVQHLEGGIITGLLVREGEPVVAGQPLVQLDLGSGGMDVEELRARLGGLMLRRARLDAELEGLSLALPADLAARHPEVAEAERAAFDRRRDSLQADLAVIAEQVRQRELEIEEIRVRLASAQRNRDLAAEQRNMSRDLQRQRLVSRMEVVSLEREVEELTGTITTLEAALPRASAQLAEARERRAQAQRQLRREAGEERADVQAEISRIRETLRRAQEQSQRTMVVSPIDGVVENMRFTTIGGVVRPGEPLMEVVPTQDRLVVEARIAPVDIGYVDAGHPVTVKLTTYDYLRYGGLKGRIRLIAADATQDPQTGAPYFRAVVETDETHLIVDGERFAISPGMEAMVDIHIGTKTVAAYLVQPVLKLRHEAFRER